MHADAAVDLFGHRSTVMERIEVCLTQPHGLEPVVVVRAWPEGKQRAIVLAVNLQPNQSVGTVLGQVGKLVHAYYRTPKGWREQALHVANVLGRQGYEADLS